MKNLDLRKYISILFGIFFVLLIIWNRLIRDRLPREIFTDYSSFFISIYIILFCTSVYIVIYSLREIFSIVPKYKILNKLLIDFPLVEKIFRKLADWVINIILTGPKNLYEFVKKRIYIKPIIDKICKKITILGLNEKPIVLYILLLIKYSFIFYVCFIFFIDVFIFNYLSYFYKSFLLLFIPLIIDLILFMIYNLAKKNSSIIKEWINFIPNKTGDWYDMRLNIDNQE